MACHFAPYGNLRATGVMAETWSKLPTTIPVGLPSYLRLIQNLQQDEKHFAVRPI